MTSVLFAIIVLVVAALIANEYYIKVVQKDSVSNHIIRNSRNKHDSIAIGSTYCRYAIDDKNNGILNLGFNGQFLYYTDLFLRHYAPQTLKKGGVVYIICADLVFAREGKGLYGPGKYIGVLTKEELGEDYTLKNFLKYRLPIFFTPSILKSIVAFLIKGRKNSYNDTTANPFSESEVLAFSKRRCDSWCSQFDLKDTLSAEIPTSLEDEFAKTRRLLSGMIDYCLNIGYKPVLVVAPNCGIMNNLISDEFIEKVLYSNIRQANHRGVQLLDYLRDKRFDDYRLYDRSGDCLNARGRKLFTEILIADTI